MEEEKRVASTHFVLFLVGKYSRNVGIWSYDEKYDSDDSEAFRFLRFVENSDTENSFYKEREPTKMHRNRSFCFFLVGFRLILACFEKHLSLFRRLQSFKRKKCKKQHYLTHIHTKSEIGRFDSSFTNNKKVKSKLLPPLFQRGTPISIFIRSINRSYNASPVAVCTTMMQPVCFA